MKFNETCFLIYLCASDFSSVAKILASFFALFVVEFGIEN
jgi:hypothetical protein